MACTAAVQAPRLLPLQQGAEPPAQWFQVRGPFVCAVPLCACASTCARACACASASVRVWMHVHAAWPARAHAHQRTRPCALQLTPQPRGSLSNLVPRPFDAAGAAQALQPGQALLAVTAIGLNFR